MYHGSNNSNGHSSGGVGFLFHTFRALGQPNYFLFFIGQVISLIGTWMQSVALPWLVYSFPHATPMLLGTVVFASQIPAFLLSPFGGLVADRLDRRQVIIVTQALSMLQAFALAALVLSRTVEIWHVMALSVFIGVVAAFDVPARQSFVVDLTEDKEVLANAIALNSSIFNGARLFGPWIAGVLIYAVGTGVCFFINGCSFIAVIACLMAMRTPRGGAGQLPASALTRLREGFSYAWEFPPIRYLLLLLVVVSLVGVPYTVLLPVFAKNILHGTSRTYGYLLTCSGVGALAGALFLASRRSVLGLGRWISIAVVLFGSGVVIFSLSRTLWLSCAALVITGFGMIVHMASSNTIIQTVVDEDKRGRVMSIHAMAFLGAFPLGGLLAGFAAGRIGPSVTVLIGGVACVASAGLFALKLPHIRKHVRPIYTRLGILPDTPLAQSMPASVTEDQSGE